MGWRFRWQGPRIIDPGRTHLEVWPDAGQVWVDRGHVAQLLGEEPDQTVHIPLKQFLLGIGPRGGVGVTLHVDMPKTAVES